MDSTTHVVAYKREDLKLFGIVTGALGTHVRIYLSTSYIIVSVGSELSLRNVFAEHALREFVEIMWGAQARVGRAF